MPVEYIGQRYIQQTIVLQCFGHCPAQQLEVLQHLFHCRHHSSSQRACGGVRYKAIPLLIMIFQWKC